MQLNRLRRATLENSSQPEIGELCPFACGIDEDVSGLDVQMQYALPM